MSAKTIQQLLVQSQRAVTKTLGLSTTEARIEVQMLLQRVLKVPRVYLLAHSEQILDETQQANYDLLLQRRLQGEPIAHLLGEREFFGLNFKVTPATLIPRPETELLVDLALHRMPQGRPCRLLDLGTGSGAIALTIAHARPNVDVVAVDASDAALQVARENAQRFGLVNAHFLHSDWFSALDDDRFDLIVSNPPYIAADDTHLAQGDVRFEPMSALASGVDGLDDIRHIVTVAPNFLAANGWLLLEHGYDQAGAVRTLLRENGFDEIFSAKDIAGIERASGGRVPL